ncbi:hypothetical protein [Rhizobium sp. 11_C7_N12_5]|uniref:hypothetical protein n=1 Tax=Rhizobium sp. 11_C7_N12_5 TaxID=3240770 RepID=UPI003F24BEA9
MRLLMSLSAVAVLSAVALSSCVTSKVAEADQTIQQKLAQLCPKLDATHDAFTIATVFFHVPANVIDAEKTAHAGVQAFCTDPSTVTIENAPQKVQDAIDAINKAREKSGQ